MKQIERFNVFLAVVTGLVLLWMVVLRAFAPAAILPKLDLMLICAVTLAALVLEYYTGPRVTKRNWLAVLLLNAATFALLPLAAGLLSGEGLLRFALAGCVAATVLAFLFTAICDRLASGSAGKVAPAAQRRGALPGRAGLRRNVPVRLNHQKQAPGFVLCAQIPALCCIHPGKSVSSSSTSRP